MPNLRVLYPPSWTISAEIVRPWVFERNHRRMQLPYERSIPPLIPTPTATRFELTEGDPLDEEPGMPALIAYTATLPHTTCLSPSRRGNEPETDVSRLWPVLPVGASRTIPAGIVLWGAQAGGARQLIGISQFHADPAAEVLGITELELPTMPDVDAVRDSGVGAVVVRDGQIILGLQAA